MSRSGVLEIAFGHGSSQSEASSLGTKMTYLGAALVLSAHAVPWLSLGTQLRFHTFPQRSRAGSQEQGGSGTSLLCAEADPEGTQLFCRGRYLTES